MKKLLTGLLVIGFMSTSLFSATFTSGWVNGKISRIQKNTSNKLVIYMIPTSDPAAEYQGTLDQTMSDTERKEFIAILLTAKASDSDIELYSDGSKWLYFKY